MPFPCLLTKIGQVQFLTSQRGISMKKDYNFLTRNNDICTLKLLNVPIWYPLKTPENKRFSGVCRGYPMVALDRKGLIEHFKFYHFNHFEFYLLIYDHGLLSQCSDDSSVKWIWQYDIGNKAKGRISNGVFQENKARQIFGKTNISNPLTRTRTYMHT